VLQSETSSIRRISASIRSILTQNANPEERKLRLRWLLAISSFPLFGIITAFGIAPQTITQNIAVTTVIEEIALPPDLQLLKQTSTDVATFWQADKVRRDDTLASLLSRLNIRNAEAVDYLRHNAEARGLATQLKPGHFVQAQTSQEGELIKLQYQINLQTTLTINRTPTGYESLTAEPILEAHSVLKSAEIESSLFAATDDANIPDAIATQIAEIFSTDIDFHNDLRKGDRFAVVYEANYSNGELVKTGQILAVEFVNQGQTYRAVMYRDASGKASYYTPEGKSLNKSFLRSPLEFSRISSGFSTARFHPILNKIRTHKGVDYAAPIGTRIKAPGDGVVNFAGVKNGYGNVIVIQHPNNISTVYGHMSGFANGVHKGMKVTQGDIIGYVGMTGLATGPHLHYEFLLNGEHRDPVSVALPMAAPVPAIHMADFMARSTTLTAQLHMLGTTRLASLE
jgi:murein DD-endopeptidase MepM/ murein hydrolase activator NlpD